MTWSSLHLGGRLIFTAGIYIGNDGYIDVSSLDLATGAIEPIFQTPDAGWVDSAAVSPDGTQMVISYAPPVSAPHGGQETLYALPTDGSKPAQLLFPPADPKDQNAQVVWAPDGKNLYFAHMNYHSPGPLSIWRVAYPDGAPQKLLDNAYWPRLSDDATRLTYVTLDPQTGQNYLYVANADGTGALEVPVQGPYISNVIDVPMFSPDGQSILFSAQDPPQSSILRGLDSILGAGLVHLSDGSIPSDWWSVPITGGAPKQLTHLGALSLYGGYSPDKQYIVSSSVNGIFIMRPDGSSLTMIVPDIGGIPGTVQWIP
ncbi:MAG TPA: hypothetical protein VMJ64_03785 [Anaerolineales bacterium]|nr:hypothetical protein [Anaerolineales bacterium]